MAVDSPRSAVDGLDARPPRWLARSGDPGDGAVVEPPGAVVVVQRVVVAADHVDRPAALTEEEEQHVARRRRLLLVPAGDQRVDDDVTLGMPRDDARVRLAQRGVAPVRAHARDVDATIGT